MAMWPLVALLPSQITYYWCSTQKQNKCHAVVTKLGVGMPEHAWVLVLLDWVEDWEFKASLSLSAFQTSRCSVVRPCLKRKRSLSKSYFQFRSMFLKVCNCSLYTAWSIFIFKIWFMASFIHPGNINELHLISRHCLAQWNSVETGHRPCPGSCRAAEAIWTTVWSVFIFSSRWQLPEINELKERKNG